MKSIDASSQGRAGSELDDSGMGDASAGASPLRGNAQKKLELK